MKIRLITYNIHKGIGGLDRLYRPERIVDAVARYEPDIVLLQEVDEGVPRSRGDRQVDVLGEALGLAHRVFHPNVKLRRGHYGNAILSRFPFTEEHRLDLTMPMKKRRGAIAVNCHLTLNGHSRTLKVFNLHLGLAGYERKRQLRKLLNWDVLDHTQAATPLVVAGDFNDVWGNLGRVVMEPAGFRPAMGRVLTFPAYAPVMPLDRVFLRGEVRVENCFACRSELARRASDHRPLVVELTVTEPN